MLRPRFSSRSSAEAKKNARSSTRAPPRLAPYWSRSSAGGSWPSTLGRVPGVVAHEVEGAAPQLVRARARDDVDHATLGTTELRFVAGGDDLELLDGVLGEALEGSAVERIVVVGAVDDERGRRGTLTEDRELLIGDTGRVGLDARHQVDQIFHVAAVERQVLDSPLPARATRARCG